MHSSSFGAKPFPLESSLKTPQFLEQNLNL